jgi:hypothetical protein
MGHSLGIDVVFGHRHLDRKGLRIGRKIAQMEEAKQRNTVHFVSKTFDGHLSPLHGDSDVLFSATEHGPCFCSTLNGPTPILRGAASRCGGHGKP